MDNNNNNNNSSSDDHNYMTVTVVPRLLLDPSPYSPDQEAEEEFCCWNKNIKLEISKLLHKKYLENRCHYPTYLQQSDNRLNHESQGGDLAKQQQQLLAACLPLVSPASSRGWQVWAGLWSRLAPAWEGRWPSWPPSWWAGRWLSWSGIWKVSLGVGCCIV